MAGTMGGMGTSAAIHNLALGRLEAVAKLPNDALRVLVDEGAEVTRSGAILGGSARIDGAAAQIILDQRKVLAEKLE